VRRWGGGKDRSKTRALWFLSGFAHTAEEKKKKLRNMTEGDSRIPRSGGRYAFTEETIQIPPFIPFREKEKKERGASHLEEKGMKQIEQQLE